MKKHKSFFISTLALSCSLLCLHMLMTAFFDPNGYLWLTDIKHVNQIKNGNGTTGRISKGLALNYRTFDAVIAGTSRVLVGMDPELLNEQHSNPYNLGLSGLNMYEMENILEYTQEKQDLDAIYIGLDFLMFAQKRKFTGDFNSSAFNGVDENKTLTKYLVGNNPLDNLATLRMSVMNNANSFAVKNGWHNKENTTVNHPALFEQTLKQNFLTNKQTYSGYQYDPERLKKLNNAIKLFIADETKVYLFINPVHAYQLEAIHGLGLWTTFQNWKRELVRTVDEINSETNQSISLWDFAYHNIVTKEAIKNKNMKWFWESSHYKKITGDLILSRILEKTDNNFGLGDKYYWFGNKLNSKNIEAKLKGNNAGHLGYHKTNTKDVNKVMQWIKQTQHSHGKEPITSF